MDPSCLLGIFRVAPARKSLFCPVKKSVSNQACSVKMAAYWSRSFFAILLTNFIENLANI